LCGATEEIVFSFALSSVFPGFERAVWVSQAETVSPVWDEYPEEQAEEEEG
jgi:hypothetical protein